MIKKEEFNLMTENNDFFSKKGYAPPSMDVVLFGGDNPQENILTTSPTWYIDDEYDLEEGNWW